jgi:hypothetical protein
MRCCFLPRRWLFETFFWHHLFEITWAQYTTFILCGKIRQKSIAEIWARVLVVLLARDKLNVQICSIASKIACGQLDKDFGF